MQVLLLFVLAAAMLVSASASSGPDVPRLGRDQDGGWVFQAGDAKYVFWGVDADTWGCDAGDIALFRKHCEASVYVNANFIAIPVTWKNVERRGPGKYDFTFVDQALEAARKYGLKAALMWIGIDYAAGDPNFVPPYIDADPETYVRIAGFGYDEQKRYRPAAEQTDREEDRLHCPSCPATLARESAAYGALMKHLAETDPQRTVMAISICGEIDYLRAMPPDQWSPERDVRCRCRHCEAAYRPGLESNVAFMTRQFATYVRTIIEAGAKHYDIPTYSQVCPHRWFPGWRYAEDPVALKAIINRANHFVVPSVACTSDEHAFLREEMDYFRPECIPGNIVFVDGIDTGWPANLSRLELAPWYCILEYGGLGAIYWDAPSVSIIKEGEVRREMFRRMWGPLKAMHYHLARLKSAGPKTRFWWRYHEISSEREMDGFTVKQVSSDKDYGVCSVLGPERLALAATTAGGPCRITFTRPGGFEGFRFERGCFDMVTGEWRKSGDAKVSLPNTGGKTVTITIDGDSGDYSQAACYVYKPSN